MHASEAMLMAGTAMMSLLSHTSFTLLDWLDYDRDVCIVGNE